MSVVSDRTHFLIAVQGRILWSRILHRARVVAAPSTPVTPASGVKKIVVSEGIEVWLLLLEQAPMDTPTRSERAGETRKARGKFMRKRSTARPPVAATSPWIGHVAKS